MKNLLEKLFVLLKVLSLTSKSLKMARKPNLKSDKCFLLEKFFHHVKHPLYFSKKTLCPVRYSLQVNKKQKNGYSQDFNPNFKLVLENKLLTKTDFLSIIRVN